MSVEFGMIIAALLAVSEVLALIPGVGSNSIFQLIVNVLKSIAPRVRKILGIDTTEEKKEDVKTK